MRLSVYTIYVTACLMAIGAAILSGVILLAQVSILFSFSQWGRCPEFFDFFLQRIISKV